MGVEDQREIEAVGRDAHDKRGRADDGEFGDAHGDGLFRGDFVSVFVHGGLEDIQCLTVFL